MRIRSTISCLLFGILSIATAGCGGTHTAGLAARTIVAADVVSVDNIVDPNDPGIIIQFQTSLDPNDPNRSTYKEHGPADYTMLVGKHSQVLIDPTRGDVELLHGWVFVRVPHKTPTTGSATKTIAAQAWNPASFPWVHSGKKVMGGVLGNITNANGTFGSYHDYIIAIHDPTSGEAKLFVGSNNDPNTDTTVKGAFIRFEETRMPGSGVPPQREHFDPKQVVERAGSGQTTAATSSDDDNTLHAAIRAKAKRAGLLP